MSLLRQLILVDAAPDDSRLPEQTIKHIQGLIQKGAKDLEQKWANALQLVHKAYEVANVERPTPYQKSAWKQYEELIAFSVEWLSKTRGLNSDWRMSAAMFRESLIKKRKFDISLLVDGKEREYEVEAESIKSIVESIRTSVSDPYKVDPVWKSNGVNLRFWRFNILLPQVVRIDF